MQLKKLRVNVIKGEGLWTEFELFDFCITCVMLLLVDLSRAFNSMLGGSLRRRHSFGLSCIQVSQLNFKLCSGICDLHTVLFSTVVPLNNLLKQLYFACCKLGTPMFTEQNIRLICNSVPIRLLGCN